jgi:hypothetical protein
MNEHLRKALQAAERQLDSKAADELIQEAAYDAIEQSILHRNTTSANQLLGALPRLMPRRRNARPCLAAYLERWGNLVYREATRGFEFRDLHDRGSWTENYKASIRNSIWTKMLTNDDANDPVVRDAAKEFRKLIDSLRKHDQSFIGHRQLLEKFENVLSEYGRTDEWARESKRVMNLFDESTRRKTMRATKYAKGS